MIFLRWTRHVVSIVTLVAAAVVAGFVSQEILEARQTVPIEQQNKARDKAEVRAQPEQPPAPTRVTVDGTVTVVNQPDPKQEQRDAEQRAQTRFANSLQVWTLILLGVAAGGAIGAWLANYRAANAAEKQVAILRTQVDDGKKEATEQRRIALESLVETKRVADAAKESADTAASQLRLLYEPCLEIANPRTTNWDSDAEEDRRAALKLELDIVNVGSTPIQFREVYSHTRLGEPGVWWANRRHEQTQGAGRRFTEVIGPYNLAPEQEQMLKEARLIVDVQLTFVIHHPLENKLINRTINQRFRCDVYSSPERLRYSDVAGWPDPPSGTDQEQTK